MNTPQYVVSIAGGFAVIHEGEDGDAIIDDDSLVVESEG